MAFEQLRVVRDAARFDAVVRDGAPEGGDIEFVAKAGATQAGRTAVAITFTAMVDEKVVRVQAVTTLRALRAAVLALPEEP